MAPKGHLYDCFPMGSNYIYIYLYLYACVNYVSMCCIRSKGIYVILEGLVN